MSYSKEQIKSMVTAEAIKQGLDPALALAVAANESGFDPDATSQAGAQGVMQLMPATAEWLGVNDPYNPESNIRAGVKYLKMLYSKYHDTSKTLAAYNFGPGNVDRGRSWPKETRDYVGRVKQSWGSYAKNVWTPAWTPRPSGSDRWMSSYQGSPWDQPDDSTPVNQAGFGTLTLILILLAGAGYLIKR